jgi:hypothetical protein
LSGSHTDNTVYWTHTLDPTLPAIRVRRLLKLAGVKPDATEVGPGAALLVWVDGLLSNRQPVGEEQRQLIIEEFAADIVQAGDDAARSVAGPVVAAVLLSIVDNTFAAISGQQWLDLRTGLRLAHPPRVPVEMVTYNLRSIYVLHAQRLREQKQAAAQA